MSNTPIISAIAAIGEKTRAMGRNNKNMWKIARDKTWFEDKTLGRVVIMGRKTFEHINKMPLSGRTNIVITSQVFDTPGFIFVPTIEEALKKARELETEEVFIVGGAQIYTLALPHTQLLYLTLIDGDYDDADTFFPDYDDFGHEIYREDIDETPMGGYKYSFTIRER